KSTLEESTHVDLLIHVIDASNPHHEVHEKTVQKLMAEMDIQGIPVLNVYNKMDMAKDFVPTLAPAVQLSIKSAEGVQWLRTAILEKLHELFVAFELDLPYAMAYKLPELKKIAMVNDVVEGETAYKVKGLIAPNMTWKLDNY
ncbi:GTPase HflX, partial [Lactococcus formosensis]|nr:GTPase HflX [Lactococcus formosensis]